MLLTTGVAVLFAVLGLLFAHHIALMLGTPSSGPIHDMAEDYLQAVSLGTPFLLVFLSLIPV